MLNLNLKEMGLITVENFLDRDFCNELIRETKDLIHLEDSSEDKRLKLSKIHPTISRAITSFPSGKTEIIGKKLSLLIPEIEAFYNKKLLSVQPPKVNIYKVGDRFAPHIDSEENYEKKIGEKRRRISTVIFLNDESDFEDESETFSGGKLTFHKLLKPPFDKFGLPITAQTGMLIIFPGNYLHEVTEITRGKRYVVNSGYFD